MSRINNLESSPPSADRSSIVTLSITTLPKFLTTTIRNSILTLTRKSKAKSDRPSDGIYVRLRPDGRPRLVGFPFHLPRSLLFHSTRSPSTSLRSLPSSLHNHAKPSQSQPLARLRPLETPAAGHNPPRSRIFRPSQSSTTTPTALAALQPGIGIEPFPWETTHIQSVLPTVGKTLGVHV